MNLRLKIIQCVIDKLKAKTYLEIGLGNGNLFYSIKAPKKIGVDPKQIKKKFENYFYNFNNFFCMNFKMSSDEFFRKEKKLLFKYGLDVVFIDGLHTFEQSLRDVSNSLKYLNDKGVIIIHDCNPPSNTIGYPANSHRHVESLNLPDWDGLWCGDVWKTILYLRKAYKNLEVFVLDCEMGLGFITKKSNTKEIYEVSLEEIKKLNYRVLESNRKEILNLKNPDYYYKFINKIYSSTNYNLLYILLMKIDYVFGFLRKIKIKLTMN